MSDQIKVPQLRLVQSLESAEEIMDDGTGVAPGMEQGTVVEPMADTVDLLLGTEAQTIAALQNNLKVWGFAPGEYDGVYGEKTKEAVRALQAKLGLQVTGQFDEATRQAVQADLNAGGDSNLRRAAVAPPVEQPAAEPGTAAAAKTPWAWIIGIGVALYWLVKPKKTGVAGLADVTSLTFDSEEVPEPRRKKRKKHKPTRKQLAATPEPEPEPEKPPKPPRAKKIEHPKASDTVIDAEVVLPAEIEIVPESPAA